MTQIEIVVELCAEGAAMTALLTGREVLKGNLSQSSLATYNREIAARRARIMALAEVTPTDLDTSPFFGMDTQLYQTAQAWVESIRRLHRPEDDENSKAKPIRLCRPALRTTESRGASAPHAH